MSNLDFTVPGKEELAERVATLVKKLPIHMQDRYAATCLQARSTINGVVMSEVFEALYRDVVGLPSLIITINLVHDMIKTDSYQYRLQRYNRMTEGI